MSRDLLRAPFHNIEDSISRCLATLLDISATISRGIPELSTRLGAGGRCKQHCDCCSHADANQKISNICSFHIDASLFVNGDRNFSCCVNECTELTGSEERLASKQPCQTAPSGGSTINSSYGVCGDACAGGALFSLH
jgi:hypothetical protein